MMTMHQQQQQPPQQQDSDTYLSCHIDELLACNEHISSFDYYRKTNEILAPSSSSSSSSSSRDSIISPDFFSDTISSSSLSLVSPNSISAAKTNQPTRNPFQDNNKQLRQRYSRCNHNSNLKRQASTRATVISSASATSCSYKMSSLPASDYYSSASPSCALALGSCHLSSSSSGSYATSCKFRRDSKRSNEDNLLDNQSNNINARMFNNSQSKRMKLIDNGVTRGTPTRHRENLHHHHHHHRPSNNNKLNDNTDVQDDISKLFCRTIKPDPVYLDDEKVFYNLILKETYEIETRLQCKQQKQQQRFEQDQFKLTQPLRHKILSWLLSICRLKEFQDDIFSYATMLFDKFLLIRQNNVLTRLTKTTGDDNDEGFEANRDELFYRQLYQFAACSLLIAVKMRETRMSSKSFIDELVEFSRERLHPIGLTSDEIRQAEYLMLFTLNWDYSLVVPNDYLPIVMRKCRQLDEQAAGHLVADEQQAATSKDGNSSNNHNDKIVVTDKRDKRHLLIGKAEKIELLASPFSANKDEEDTDIGRNSLVNGDKSLGDVNMSKKKQLLAYETNILARAQELLELCLMDSQLSQYSPSILASTTLALAINGIDNIKAPEYLNLATRQTSHLYDTMVQIYESTYKVNELEQMIELAHQIEKSMQPSNLSRLYRKRGRHCIH